MRCGGSAVHDTYERREKASLPVIPTYCSRRRFAFSVYWPHHDFSAGRKAMSTTIDSTNGAVFECRESEVPSYCRNVHAIFAAASGGIVCDIDGRECIDFLSGAGSLNCGHKDLHMIAAGRYQRIPAGRDAREIASGDARRVRKSRRRQPGAGWPNYRHNDPNLRSALTEYLIRDGIAHGCVSAEQQRTALL